MYRKEIIYLGLYKNGNRMGSAGFLKVENRNQESKCFLKVQNLPMGINGRFPIRVYGETGWKEINGIAIQDGGGNWEDNLPENIDRARIQIMLSGGYMLEGRSKSAAETTGQKWVTEQRDVEPPRAEEKQTILEPLRPEEIQMLMENPRAEDKQRVMENQRPEEIQMLMELPRTEDKQTIMEPPRPEDLQTIMELPRTEEKQTILEPLRPEEKQMLMENPRAEDKQRVMENPRPEEKQTIMEPRRAEDIQTVIEKPQNEEILNDMRDSQNTSKTRNVETVEDAQGAKNKIKLERMNETNIAEQKKNTEESMKNANYVNLMEKKEDTQADSEKLQSEKNKRNVYETQKEIKSWNIGNSWRTQNRNSQERREQSNRENVQEGTEKTNSQNNRKPQTIIVTEELPRRTQTVQSVQTNTAAVQNTAEYSWKEDKWEQILDTYENIHPYGDERVYVKLEPKDFVILQSKYQHLVNNSFLLHGFYNYRYVILGKEDDYYLGVPGVFYEREKMVALMFGFEAFECPGGTVRSGEFGYYLRKVEL